MGPKFDPNEVQCVYLRAVGATSSLSHKVGPLGVSPKKISDDIVKATVTVQLKIQNRQAPCSVVPTVGEKRSKGNKNNIWGKDTTSTGEDKLECGPAVDEMLFSTTCEEMSELEDLVMEEEEKRAGIKKRKHWDGKEDLEEEEEDKRAGIKKRVEEMKRKHWEELSWDGKLEWIREFKQFLMKKSRLCL